MKKLLSLLALVLAAVSGAHAQAWPAKPVTLLVPFAPGGSTDMIARTVGSKLQEKLGGTFVVDNKAGAATSITVTSGSAQSATVNTAFAISLVATVTDQFANPVPGVSVSFASLGTGASATCAIFPR